MITEKQSYMFKLQGVDLNKTREKDDFYVTPRIAVDKLLEVEKFNGNIWECACGDGAISKVLIENNYSVYSSDLFERGYGDSHINFLTTRKEVDNIVTNPPFSLSQKFVEHAFLNATKKVVIFNKLSFLEGKRRKDMFSKYPLKKVLVFSSRIPVNKKYIIPLLDKKFKGNSLMAFAWFIWDKGYKGKPYIEWI